MFTLNFIPFCATRHLLPIACTMLFFVCLFLTIILNDAVMKNVFSEAIEDACDAFSIVLKIKTPERETLRHLLFF